MDDDFGDLDPVQMEADLIARLPELLRSRCCDPSEPCVSPDHHDHGHTDCYFVNLAADEIDRLRAIEQMVQVAQIRFTRGESWIEVWAHDDLIDVLRVHAA